MLCDANRQAQAILTGHVGAASCALACLALAAAALVAPAGARAATLPAGFSETTVFSGLTNPMAVRFASDGRVFVAEKSGLIKVFDGLSDTTPTVFADLRTQVHNFWDRGMLGLALDPNFPATPSRGALDQLEELTDHLRGALDPSSPTKSD